MTNNTVSTQDLHFQNYCRCGIHQSVFYFTILEIARFFYKHYAIIHIVSVDFIYNVKGNVVFFKTKNYIVGQYFFCFKKLPY